MNICVTTTKSDALRHINDLLGEALVKKQDDRATLASLHSRYRAIDSLEGETVRDLYERVNREVERTRKMSDRLDTAGIAGLICIIAGLAMVAYASALTSAGIIIAGLLTFMVGGFGSAIAGAHVEDLERDFDHLDWLCLSGPKGPSRNNLYS